MAENERGRGDRVKESWVARRGQAIEPTVREALAPSTGLPVADHVGGS